MAKQPTQLTQPPQFAQLTYEQAIHRLETIVAELEEGNLDLDALVDKVREAGELVKYCRDRLKGVSQDLDNLLGKMQDNDK